MLNKFLTFNLFLFAAFKASGQSCTQFLTTTETTSLKASALAEEVVYSLPGRGNQIRQSDFLRLSDNHQLLVTVLKDAIDVLDQAEVVLALKNVNQPLSYFTDNPGAVNVPEVLLSLIKNSSNKESIKDNYIFFKTYFKDSVSENAILGLSLLFGEVRRMKKASPVMNYEPKNSADKKNYINYLTGVLSRPHIAKSILRFLSNESVVLESKLAILEEHKKYSEEIAKQIIAKSATTKDLDVVGSYELNMKQVEKILRFDVEKLKSEYARNMKFSPESMNVLMAIIVRYSYLLNNYYTMENEAIASLLNLNSAPYYMSEMSRSQRVTVIEKFLTDVAQFKSLLGNLVDLIEHLLFGSSIPLKTDELELMIKNSTQNWMAPVRNQISSFKSAERNVPQTMVSNIFHTDSILLNPDWGHSPSEIRQALNPNKRKNQIGLSQSKRTESKENESALDNDSMLKIDPKLDLAKFSNFEAQPRDLSELDSATIYSFRFMRDGEDSKVYTIDFKDSVLKEFRNAPETASLLIRALNLGFARSTHEDGLKILKTHQNGQVGRFYELKSRKSNDRLILLHNNGHWKVLKYTDKTSFNRVLNELAL